MTGTIRWRERQLILPQENAYEKHKSIQTAQQKRIARHLLCCTPRNGDFATLYASNLHFATAYGSKSRPHRLPFRSASSVGAATQRQHMLPGRVILWVLSHLFEQALQTSEELGDLLEITNFQWAMADVLVNQGRLEEALTLLERALQTSEELGDQRSQAVAQGYMANLLRMQGRLQESVALYEDTILKMQELGDVRDLAVFHIKSLRRKEEMGTPQAPSGGLRGPLNPRVCDHSSTGFDISSEYFSLER